MRRNHRETTSRAAHAQPDATTAAEHTDTRTAEQADVLMFRSRKIGHASAAPIYVGAAAAATYNRAIGKYATAQDVRTRPETATVTERTATSAAGAGPQRLCSANRKKRPRQRRRSRRSSRSIPQ